MPEIEVNLTAKRPNGVRTDVALVAVVNPNGTPVGGGSSEGSDIGAVLGTTSAPMWNGLTPDPTLMSILKAIHEQNEALKRIGNETNTLLVQIAEHTRPTPTGT